MKLFLLLLHLVFLYLPANAGNHNYGQSKERIDQRQIQWLLDRHNVQEPRGGTSNGLNPLLDSNSSDYYIKLQSKNNKKEKDRLAILAMSGDYKANFEFTEIFGRKSNYKLDNPYKSWGTETILVIHNTENFISLQHILVMFMEDKNGKITGPFVQKHWRQDWSYEDRNILKFQGRNEWNINQHKDVKKAWSQAVYQVDDSPRYESYGNWIHEEGVSRWVSKMTNRPLPRREHSVRNDYDLLKGINKISILPWGWVMEENNDKIKSPKKYLGTEYGVARYQKIKDYNFSAAFEYWEATKNYWQIVRDSWNKILLSKNRFCLKKTYENSPLFMFHFIQAEKYKETKDLISAKRDVNSTINNFIDYSCSIE